MASNSSFFVYFTCTATLDDAEKLLRDSGLVVNREAEVIEVSWGEGPKLWIGLSTEPHVKLEALEVSELKGVPELAQCDRRFEVGFDDLDEVLDETNGLAVTQLALQDLTHGWITMAWNGNIMRPEGR